MTINLRRPPDRYNLRDEYQRNQEIEQADRQNLKKTADIDFRHTFNATLIDKGGAVYNVKHPDYGAVGDGTTNDTTAVQACVTAVLAAGGGVVYFPVGTYLLGNLNFTGIEHVTFRGAGAETILDFAAVTSGDALSFGYDAPSGGCKYVVVEDMTLTDSSSTSSADRLFVMEGGPTGQSPSQTSAFFTLRNIRIQKYANTSGDAVVIDGLSNVFMDSLSHDFGYGAGEGLVLLNTVNVNTGIFSAINCVFRGVVRAMRVNATGTIMDSAYFGSTFFGNDVDALAVETILFEGSQAISSFAFYGCHLENRHASLDTAVLVTGSVYAMSWVSCHLSCGTGASFNTYGFRFDAATVKGCYFSANEFLRVKPRSAGGRCFFFENTCTLDPYEPVVIGPIWRNVNTPISAEIEAGASDDVFKAVHFRPNTIDGNVVGGLDKVYTFPLTDSSPSIKYGRVFKTADATTLTSFDEGHEGQEITILAAGSMTVNDSASINLSGGVAFAMSAGDTLTLRKMDDLIWYEVARTYAGDFDLQTVNGVDFTPGSDIDVDLLTVNVTGTPRLYWDESDNRFASTHGFRIEALTSIAAQLNVNDVAGIDVNPGSDSDADLISVGVTGSPRFWWDESDDRFTVTHGLDVDAGSLRHAGPTVSAFQTIADQDATPDVSTGTNFKTANTVGTTITDFDGGVDGQTIRVVINDANTTIDFTASGLKGNAGADWSPVAGDHMTCVYDGTDWFCDISDNTA